MTEAVAAASGEFTIGGDLTVRRLGYGTMQLPGAGVWGESRDPDGAIRVLRRAIELGVNFIDTADAYGPFTADLLLKEALHPYPEDLVIATKAGFTRSGPGAWAPVGRPEYLRQAVELSLRHLGLERIDLLQLHRIDPKVPVAEQLGVLAEMQAEGKIRHLGLSEVSVDEIEEATKTAPIVSVQNLYNLSQRDAEAGPRVRRAEQPRLHPLVPARHRRSGQGRWSARRDRQGAQRDALPARPCLASQALARDAADPRHLLGRAPRGQRQRRQGRAHR